MKKNKERKKFIEKKYISTGDKCFNYKMKREKINKTKQKNLKRGQVENKMSLKKKLAKKKKKRLNN